MAQPEWPPGPWRWLLGGENSWRRVVLAGIGGGLVLAVVGAVVAAFIDGDSDPLNGPEPTAAVPAAAPDDLVPVEEPTIEEAPPVDVPVDEPLPTEPPPVELPPTEPPPLPTEPPLEPPPTLPEEPPPPDVPEGGANGQP